ncbi:MAG: stage II sporulation protein M [Verrucomicrobiales bacterium]|nr:stage II sporulation protein M [Verrucomicrobiales bacterium]
MIIDLQKFMEAERPAWRELEALLTRMEQSPHHRLEFNEVRRFHLLYERASADLVKLVTFAAEPELRRYLESLVARAYGEIHETRGRGRRFQFWHWFSVSLPLAFQTHLRAFWISLGVTVVGAMLGGIGVWLDPEAKEMLLPAMFANHQADPRDRVAREEAVVGGAGADSVTASPARMAAFSAFLMQNNIGVSIKAMALGMTYGVGTLVLLFHNGVVLGVVGLDYILAGETEFLLGWLLPHGAVEIPAILMGGQAGLALAGALIGWGSRETLRRRFRRITPDLVTLIGGVALLLVWAGIVEAFFSQFHEPAIPYALKIAFGVTELILLTVYLGRRSGVVGGVGRGKAQAFEGPRAPRRP